MAELIQMPKLSDTMEEGAIAKWLKAVGDSVEEGEPLVEIETDKATMEWESPEEGVLLNILAEDGKACPLNAPIAVIGEKGEAVDIDSLIAKAGGAGAPSASTSSEASAAPAPEPAASTPPDVHQASSSGEHPKSSPMARKMAREHGVSLASVNPSGPHGRIVMRDIESYLAKAPGGGGVSYPASAVGVSREDQIVPLTMMRKTIAKRLLAGKNEAPHFYLTSSAEMGAMLDWRRQLNDQADPERGIPKVSVNDLVVLATAKALRRHPEVNASWEGDAIRIFGGVHVAMAVALPTGLVTPVIQNTDQMGIREIAQQTRHLAIAAKEGQLSNDAYQGGTFTISNLGMFGIESFTAIINPPQAAILAVGTVEQVPVFTEDGQVRPVQRMKYTMSCDHRVVDGAMGAQFLKTLTEFLENPLMILS